MDGERLSEELQRLHAMLADPGELSEPLRDKLRVVADDIAAVLEDEDKDSGPAVSNINQIVDDFQTNHPAITDLLRRIVDGLSGIGI